MCDDTVHTEPNQRCGVFIRIPGNNNRTVQSVLDWYPKKGYFGWHCSQLCEVPDEVLKTCFSFAIVRNPFERLLSVYKTNVSGEEYSFEKFVNDVCSDNTTSLDPVLVKKTRPQWTYLTNLENDILVDFVLRYDTLHQDFETVVKELDLPPTVTIPYDVSPNIENVLVFFTEEMKKKVRKFYEIDFVTLNFK